jgi:GDP-L-fucose synthase
MQGYDGPGPINIGGGSVLSIKELAKLIKGVVGYQGELHFDTSKLDGMPLKALDSTELTAMGWQARTSFSAGLAATYRWFLHLEAKQGAHVS